MHLLCGTVYNSNVQSTLDTYTIRFILSTQSILWKSTQLDYSLRYCLLVYGRSIVITLVPWFHSVFKTQPVPVKYVCPALGFGAALFIFDEIRKYLVRRYSKSFLAKMAW